MPMRASCSRIMIYECSCMFIDPEVFLPMVFTASLCAFGVENRCLCQFMLNASMAFDSRGLRQNLCTRGNTAEPPLQAISRRFAVQVVGDRKSVV